MSISMEDVKTLRESTGAGMMDCKKALQECAGNMEDAKDWLRKKGLAAAAKKSARTASEGAISVFSSNEEGRGFAAIIELNSETDFVAKNDQFVALAREIAKIACTNKIADVEALKQAKTASGKTISDEIVEKVATIGENLNLRRCGTLSVNPGFISEYLHSSEAPGTGKIGVIVAIQSEAPSAALKELGKQLAMHIAAAKPEAVSVENLNKELIEREKAIAREQTLASGKPENIVDKIVEGRMRSFYEEVVLVEQKFVMDNKIRISEHLAKFSSDHGKETKVVGFIHFQLGEGIEKQTTDFASEVKSMAGN